MARIRSIHPGLFTDEAFVSASPLARLLIIGIWCEAFDDGCFEVKPLTLKMRLFPVDNVDVSALLSELEALGYFRRFDAKGKSWAALRNFQKYQRPKKPNKSGVLPSEMHDFVGKSSRSGETSSDDDEGGTPPVSDQSGTGGGKSPQREEGGDNREVVPPSLREDGRPAAEEREPELSFRGESEPTKPKLRLVEAEILPPIPVSAEKRLFDTGKAMLGRLERPPKDAGSLINKLFLALHKDAIRAQECVDLAGGKSDPVEFLMACTKKALTSPPPRPVRHSHDRAAIAKIREDMISAGTY